MMKKCFTGLFTLLGILTVFLGIAQGAEIVLYENDFENPNGGICQWRKFSTAFNTPAYPYYQINTADCVRVDHGYSDPTGKAGNYFGGIITNESYGLLLPHYDYQFINIELNQSLVPIINYLVNPSSYYQQTLPIKDVEVNFSFFKIQTGATIALQGSGPYTPAIVKINNNIQPSFYSVDVVVPKHSGSPDELNWKQYGISVPLSGVSVDENILMLSTIITDLGYPFAQKYANVAFDNLRITTADYSITSYTIKHYLENPDGTFTVKNEDTISESGQVGSGVVAQINTYTGYVYEPTISTTTGTLQQGQKLELSVKYLIDTDGDGTPDKTDLDDDNDGILDVDECQAYADYSDASLTWIDPLHRVISNAKIGGRTADIHFEYSSASIKHGTYSNVFGYSYPSQLVPKIILPVHVLSNVMNMAHDPSRFVNVSIHFDQPVAKLNAHFLGVDYSKVLFTGAYTERVLSPNVEMMYEPATRTLRDSDPMSVESHTRDVYGSMELSGTVPLDTFTFRYVDNDAHSDPLHSTDGNSITFSICDLDSDHDGTPDHHDLDSDNDGCPDALEGTGNIMSGALNTSGAIIGVENGSGLVLSGTIPTIQGVGQSKLAGKVVFDTTAPNQGKPLSGNVLPGANYTFSAKGLAITTTGYDAVTHLPDYTTNPGTGTVQYQWYVKTGATWTAISGATAADYTITSATPADAGNYKVVVSCVENQCQNQEAEARLDVMTLVLYPLTYDANGGTGTMGIENHTGGVVFPLTASNFTRTGYIFNGRNSLADGTGTGYANTGNFTMPFTGTTVYAQRIPASGTLYQIAHYLQNTDGTFPTTGNPIITLTGTTASTVDAGNRTFTGYTYTGGHAGNIQTGIVLADNSLLLKRYYTVNKYTLFFEENGGTLVSDQTGIVYNTTGTEPTAPTRAGYSFQGWYTTNSFTTLFAFTTPITQNTTVYAKRKKNGSSCTNCGGSPVPKDDCPDGDHSPSYYDGKCGTPPECTGDDCDTDPDPEPIPEEPEPTPTPKPTLTPLPDPTYIDTEFIKYPTVLPKTGIENYKTAGRAGARFKKGIDVALRRRDFRLAGSTNTDIAYWKQVLHINDQDRDQYIVLPKQGLVMPINTVPKDDGEYHAFINGHNQNFFKFLHNGAVQLPGNPNNYGEKGNMVIAGHSSYWEKRWARYKTHFQKIIEMEAGDEIWIYKKQPQADDNGNPVYTRYVYRTTASYNTDKTDISVLKPRGGKDLTLFTCTPIGSAEGRWIVKAEFSEED